MCVCEKESMWIPRRPFVAGLLGKRQRCRSPGHVWPRHRKGRGALGSECVFVRTHTRCYFTPLPLTHLATYPPTSLPSQTWCPHSPLSHNCLLPSQSQVPNALWYLPPTNYYSFPLHHPISSFLSFPSSVLTSSHDVYPSIAQYITPITFQLRSFTVTCTSSSPFLILFQLNCKWSHVVQTLHCI